MEKFKCIQKWGEEYWTLMYPSSSPNYDEYMASLVSSLPQPLPTPSSLSFLNKSQNRIISLVNNSVSLSKDKDPFKRNHNHNTIIGYKILTP